jgi:adenosylhomocysteinase
MASDSKPLARGEVPQRGGAMFNLAAGPGDPYDTFDLVTALMLEVTSFLATEGVQYPPGVHLLPRKVQDRAARHFLDKS